MLHFGLKLIVLIAAVICFGTVDADPRRAMENQLERYIKPCALYGRRCPPDGSVGNVDQMRQQIPELESEFRDRELNEPMPDQCECQQEECVRACWYGLTKTIFLSDFQGFLSE